MGCDDDDDDVVLCNEARGQRLLPADGGQLTGTCQGRPVQICRTSQVLLGWRVQNFLSSLSQA